MRVSGLTTRTPKALAKGWPHCTPARRAFDRPSLGRSQSVVSAEPILGGGGEPGVKQVKSWGRWTLG